MESMNVAVPMDQAYSLIKQNWEAIRQQVDDVASQHGRNAGEVLVVGVSKYVDVELTRALVAAGCRNLGESRPQSLWSKCPEIQEAGVHWHLIGHLQRNKVKRTLSYVDWIESVDSLRLLTQIENDAAGADRRPKILFEVNATQDASKTGCTFAELLEMAEYATTCQNIQVAGLMGMASLDGTPDKARAEFAAIREYRDRVAQQFGNLLDLRELSMGMSGDFREAIAEGATIVRIGSALFEGVLQR
jgi:PLP dependent protein